MVFVFSLGSFDLPAQAQSSQRTDLHLFHNSQLFKPVCGIPSPKDSPRKLKGLKGGKTLFVQNTLFVFWGFFISLVYKEILHFDLEKKIETENKET